MAARVLLDLAKLVIFGGGLVCIAPTVVPRVVPGPKQGWTPTDWEGAHSWAKATLVIFGGLWVLEFAAKAAMDALHGLTAAKLLDPPRNRAVLARHVMDTTALCTIGYIGVDMWLKQRLLPVPATARDRLYIRLPEFEFLAVLMLAFQTKNFVDSLTWKDPFEYVAHHAVCIGVAIGALHGHFLHLYGIFFFGVSEVSTAVLSGLAAFDEEHGVAALADLLPITKTLLGAVFVVLFLTIRLGVWPYLSYFLTLDALEVLDKGTAHSDAIVYAHLGCLLGLTCLQFYWLTELIKRAKEELFKTAKAKSN